MRVFSLEGRKRNMRELNPADIDTMISVRGMVIRLSPIIPDLRFAFFACSRCATPVEVEVVRGRVDEPMACTKCGAKKCMTMVHNRSLFTDKQLVKVQETPESIPEGETPQTVSLYACVMARRACVPPLPRARSRARARRCPPGGHVCVRGRAGMTTS